MLCPYCKSTQIVKNGRAPSKKQRWKCKSCEKSFDEYSNRKFPPTSIPFPFIAFILYTSEDKSVIKTYKDVKYIMQLLKLFHVQIMSKEDVSYVSVYKWKHEYQSFYKELISFNEAKKYYFDLFRNANKPDIVMKNDEEPPYYFLPERPIKYTHMMALKEFKKMTDFIGVDALSYMRSNAVIVPQLLESYKKNRKTSYNFGIS